MEQRMPAAPPAEADADRPLRGVALICLAVLCFVTMNTMIKELGRPGHDLPVPFLVWGRYFFHLVLIMALFPRRVPRLLETRRVGIQVVRSVLVLMATACMFTAVQFMPLADVVSISFVAPLLATGLSVVILHERVGPRRWAAVAIGFVGALIIIRPGLGVVHWAAFLPLAMATFYALYQNLTRIARADADPLNALFYTALVGAVVTSLAVPFFWTWPTPVEWAMLVAAGFFGGAGHFAVIKAYERAQVSVVAPFAYTEIVWATLFGYAVFGDFPDLWTFVGAAVIAGAGLYVLHRERIKARPA